jgi:polyhydroxyalkanoate synthesis regulator phasin
MIKKLKPDDDEQRLTEAVRISSQEIWQAGLHAFARAQEQGGKQFSMQIFEQRVLRALSAIGVPTAEEVARLQARVDELSAQLAALTASQNAAAQAPARAAGRKPSCP